MKEHTPSVEWDETKNQINIKKHGVSFEEAQTVFFDEYALYLPDPAHSETEERFNILGASARFRILLVCHCYRDKGDTVRIISARKADPSERKTYETRLKRR